jgi:hypothetical protein
MRISIAFATFWGRCVLKIPSMRMVDLVQVGQFERFLTVRNFHS